MAIQKPWASIPILHRCCGVSLTRALPAGNRSKTPSRGPRKLRVGGSVVAGARVLLPVALLLGAGFVPSLLMAGAATQTKSHSAKSQSAKSRQPASPKAAVPQADQELERLARALRDKPANSLYDQLSQFQAQHAKTALGARAALALGYYDYTRGHAPEARTWLEKAVSDPLLADYALYWKALNDRALGANDLALTELQQYRLQYPDSVITDAAVEALARAALAVDRPDDALAALNDYPKTTTKVLLVLLRAQAREKIAAAKSEMPFAATTDYLDVVYRFPLSDEAKTAAEKIPYLRAELGEQFPGTPLETEIARAETFYDARRWSDLRAAYQSLLPKLSGAALDRAQLHLAQGSAQAGAGPRALASLTPTDPDVDAERLYLLSQAYRSAMGRMPCCGPIPSPDMFAAIEQLATKYPQSSWTAQGLYAAGNYHWASLDRDQAAEFYQRMVAAFPTDPNANIARWRIVWTAYLERQAGVQDMLEQFLNQYPTSGYVVDALYWLGRANERAGNVARARNSYAEAVQRFPQTYFGRHAAERLREIGQQAADPAPVDFQFRIPPAAPLDPFIEPLPADAQKAWSRAQALEGVAFDNSAELELHAAYTTTRAPQLLLAAAQAAVADGRYAVGIVTVRQLVPQLEARRIEDVPMDAWRVAYPLPNREPLESEARRSRLDPMLIAGLIRQESGFAADAVSRMGAVGLMQVEPKTGARLAKSLRLQFSRSRLFDPEYNLRLGTVYFSGLLASYATPEAALAAYNAGEDRVAEWTMGQNYEETPEFVESIPFTETREYVQIVLRNAELYRAIYALPVAVEPEPKRVSTRHG
jgi:soluble lytic murein transglycosylase